MRATEKIRHNRDSSRIRAEGVLHIPHIRPEGCSTQPHPPKNKKPRAVRSR